MPPARAATTTTKPRAARAPKPEAARRGSEGPDMSRTGWTTIAIPNELHAEITKHHIPGRARSVQAYIIFWARAGSLIDRAVDSSSDPRQLLTVLESALKNGRPFPSED